MWRRWALACAALAGAAGVALAQDAPPPPGERPAAAPGATPAEAQAPEAAPAEEPSLRRRRRPRISAHLPEHPGVVEFSAGALGGLLDGAVQKDAELLFGTRFEFDDDLDLTRTVGVPVVELSVHLAKRFSIVVDGFWVRASGSAPQTLSTAFDGGSFPAGAVLDAELSALSGAIAARYFASSSDGITFEIEAGVRYVGSRFEIAGTAGGAPVARLRETTDAFVPFVGFLGSHRLWQWGEEAVRFEARLRLGVFGLGDGDDNQTNAYFHAYGGVSVPIPGLRSGRFGVRVTLGYELIRLDAQREHNQLDEDLELLLHGAALRVVVGF